MNTIELVLEYAEIELLDGSVARVDATDHQRLAQHTWHRSNGYAARKEDNRTVYMHREVLGLAETSPATYVKRLNGDKLDNRRANLLVCKWAPYQQYPGSESAEVRLLESIELDGSGCWLWVQTRDPNGYGLVSIEGIRRRAPRVSYETFVGAIPSGLHLDHLCRRPACINPEHLEAVTPRENIMRGETPAAANAAKTHCPQGHPYDENNTYWTPSGSRHCKECVRAAQRRYKARLKERAAQ